MILFGQTDELAPWFIMLERCAFAAVTMYLLAIDRPRIESVVQRTKKEQDEHDDTLRSIDYRLSNIERHHDKQPGE